MKKKTYGKMRKSHRRAKRTRRARRTRRTGRGGGWFSSKKPPTTMSSLHDGLPPQPQEQTDSLPSGFTILRKHIDNITRDEFKRLKTWRLKQGIDYETDVQKQALEQEIQDKIVAWGMNNARRVHQAIIQEERDTQAAIDAVNEYELTSDPVLVEKRNAQRLEKERQREKQQRDEEESENQYTSPSVIYNKPSGVGPSGVGWMGWDANDEATWQRPQRRAPQIRAPQNYLPTLSWYGRNTSAGYQHDGHLGENGHHATK